MVLWDFGVTKSGNLTFQKLFYRILVTGVKSGGRKWFSVILVLPNVVKPYLRVKISKNQGGFGGAVSLRGTTSPPTLPLRPTPNWISWHLFGWSLVILQLVCHQLAAPLSRLEVFLWVDSRPSLWGHAGHALIYLLE